MSLCVLRDLFLAPLIRHKNEACTTLFVMLSFNNCLSSSPAGSQFGWMRHKENARAPTFSHGALGFIVSFVLDKELNSTPPPKKTPDFLMTPLVNKTSCQDQCQLCELSKTLTLPSFKSKNIKSDVMFACCFPWSVASPRSHNLEYDSSEEKNPRLIFYNEKDEVVKVRCEHGGSFFLHSSALWWSSSGVNVKTHSCREVFKTAASDIRSCVRYRVESECVWKSEAELHKNNRWQER